MALNLEQLEAYLVEANLKYRLEEEGHLLTGFATSCYVTDQGIHGVAVAVCVTEDGRFLEFTAPRLYDATGCREPGKLFQALLEITMKTKLLRFEILASVTFPVEDGIVTPRQFRRMLEAIPKAIDRWHPVIRHAIERGVVDLDLAAQPRHFEA